MLTTRLNYCALVTSYVKGTNIMAQAQLHSII